MTITRRRVSTGQNLSRGANESWTIMAQVELKFDDEEVLALQALWEDYLKRQEALMQSLEDVVTRVEAIEEKIQAQKKDNGAAS